MGLGSYSKTAPTSRHAEREEIHAPEGRAPPGRRKEGEGGWGERRNRAADSKKSNSAQVPGPACGKAGKTLSAGKCTFAICNDANAHNRPISKAQIRCTATESRPVGALHARCQKTQSYAAISAQSYALFLYTLPGTVTTWASSELNLPYATGADEATRWCCYRRRICGYI